MQTETIEVLSVYDGTQTLEDILLELITQTSKNTEKQLDQHVEKVYNKANTSNMVESQSIGGKI